MTEPSGYVLEALREGPDFTLYRDWQDGTRHESLRLHLPRNTRRR